MDDLFLHKSLHELCKKNEWPTVDLILETATKVEKSSADLTFTVDGKNIASKVSMQCSLNSNDPIQLNSEVIRTYHDAARSLSLLNPGPSEVDYNFNQKKEENFLKVNLERTFSMPLGVKIELPIPKESNAPGPIKNSRRNSETVKKAKKTSPNRISRMESVIDSVASQTSESYQSTDFSATPEFHHTPGFSNNPDFSRTPECFQNPGFSSNSEYSTSSGFSKTSEFVQKSPEMLPPASEAAQKPSSILKSMLENRQPYGVVQEKVYYGENPNAYNHPQWNDPNCFQAVTLEASQMGPQMTVQLVPQMPSQLSSVAVESVIVPGLEFPNSDQGSRKKRQRAPKQPKLTK